MKPKLGIYLQGPAEMSPMRPIDRWDRPSDLRARGEAMGDSSFHGDHLLTVLSEICDALAGVDGVRFAVRAFDRVPWPVSVSVDLCVLLEQLPDVVAAADQGRSFELDFFEQGIERTLHAEARDEDFEFSCSCRLETWAPQWRVERVPQVTFRQMLRALVVEFNRLAAAVRPDLVAHPQFARWADAVRGRVPRVVR